jgi:hypothetical protein
MVHNMISREFWEFRNDQIRATSNMTMRRDKHDN